MQKIIMLCALMGCIFLYSTTKGQAPVNATGFSIQSSYLSGGKVVLEESSTSSFIKFDVTYSKFGGAGYIRTRLVTFTSSGGTKVPLTIADEIDATDFPAGVFVITKTYNVSLQNSLLTGQPIYLAIQGSATGGLEGLYNNGTPAYQYHPHGQSVTINTVNLVEKIILDPNHYHTPDYAMEPGIFNFVYEASYIKNNTSIQDNDIYFEWTVADNSLMLPGQKQFLIYPYGTSSSTQQNGGKKITMETNDFQDSFDSWVYVRAKSISTGQYISPQFQFGVNGIYH